MKRLFDLLRFGYPKGILKDILTGSLKDTQVGVSHQAGERYTAMYNDL